MIHGKTKMALILASVTVLLLNGCTKMIAIGEVETYCQEHGADYSDDGVCLTPIEVFKHKHEIDIANRAGSKYVSNKQGEY